MHRFRQLLVWFVDVVTFRQMFLRRKFLMFTVGVALWYWVLAAFGLRAVTSVRDGVLIGVALFVSHALLILFAVTFTRSIVGPIDEIIAQVRALHEGVLGTRRRIPVSTSDEVGELTVQFNELLDALTEINTFKKVIEEDAALDDVFLRLGAVFEARELPGHRIMTVQREGRGLQSVVGTEGSATWCDPVIEGNASLCRAVKTAAPVASTRFPGICNKFQGEPA